MKRTLVIVAYVAALIIGCGAGYHAARGGALMSAERVHDAYSAYRHGVPYHLCVSNLNPEELENFHGLAGISRVE